MRYLDSFGYGVHSLCELTRNMEMNAEGLSRFWISMSNLAVRFFHWIMSSKDYSKKLLIKLITKVKAAFTNKSFLSGLLMSSSKKNNKIYMAILRVSVIILAISFLGPKLAAMK